MRATTSSSKMGALQFKTNMLRKEGCVTEKLTYLVEQDQGAVPLVAMFRWYVQAQVVRVQPKGQSTAGTQRIASEGSLTIISQDIPGFVTIRSSSSIGKNAGTTKKGPQVPTHSQLELIVVREA